MTFPTWTWTIDALTKPTRVDTLVAQALLEQRGQWNVPTPPLVTRSQVQRAVAEGRLKINGKPVLSGSFKPQRQDQLALVVLPPEPLELVPEAAPIPILYQDSDLAVVFKPQGLTVHPSLTQKSNTLVHRLLFHIKDLSGVGGKLRPGIVHRIDKDTSGILVVSKSDRAHQGLAELFAAHRLTRKYWALCYGSPKSTQPQKIETWIGRSPSDRKKMAILDKPGKKAITFYRVLEEYRVADQREPFASLVEATLETGRTHQVRVHLSALGHSIIGDPVYGSPRPNQDKWKKLPKVIQGMVSDLNGQCLHAQFLEFRHPISHQTLRFEAAPTGAFLTLLEQLRGWR